MENKMQIEELIKKFHLGTLSNEELTSLLSYLKDNKPQHEILTYYQNIWNKPDEFQGEINSEKIYNQIAQTIGISSDESSSEIKKAKRAPRLRQFRLVLRYAAVFIFAFGLSWAVHLHYSSRTGISPVSIAGQVQTIDVPYGSKSRVVLPDGSVVNLNSGSSLKYSSSDFNSDSRSVFLTGEGYFSVTKDSERPFYVTTTGIKLKVLGTTFNLKAYPDEETEEATLITGKVEIYASNDKTEIEKPIVLKPNQKAVFLKSEKRIQPVDSAVISQTISPFKLQTVRLQPKSITEQTISWTENELIFNNEPFSSLVTRIERWYNVKILVNYPELNSARFTGKFDRETLEQVLNALETVTPFNYNIKQNLITISEK
jgi:transmembrane sensor